MNNVVQTGYLTEDAKITPPKGNTSKMATFSMGVSRPFSDATDFFNYVAWGAAADYIEKGLRDGKCRKGCKVEVRESIIRPGYVDRSGKKKYGLEVRCDETHSEIHPSFLRQNQNNGYGNPGNPGNPRPNNANRNYNENYNDGRYQDSYAPQPDPQRGRQYDPRNGQANGRYNDGRDNPDSSYNPNGGYNGGYNGEYHGGGGYR